MSAAREVTGTGADPVTLDVALDAGRVRVNLAPPAEDGASLRARIEADPDTPPSWLRGLGAVLGFLGADGPSSPDERADAAVAATTLEWDPEARRLTVRGPRDLGLRGVPLAVTVRAPRDSVLRVRAGAARVAVEGRAGEVSVHGTGEVHLDDVSGRTELRCGAGEVRIGQVRAPLEITTGAGRVRLGEVHADVAVRAAAGDVEVADAVAGDVEIGTGVGSLWVGVHPGVDAKVVLNAAAGRVRSELPVRADRPDQPDGGPLRVRARTGAGDVTVATARPRPALTA